MRAGSDLAGAADAYRAAIKLDPDDHSAQADLAILLEYDPAGRRYSGQSKMKEAIAEYRELGQDKLEGSRPHRQSGLRPLLRRRFRRRYKAAQALNPQPKALLAASEAMLQDSKAGLDEANKRSSDEAAFKETARTAGEMLMNFRQYPLAADFLQAGAAGDNAAQTMGLATVLRTAQHHEDLHFANTPVDLVKHAFLLTMDPESD